MYRIYSPLAVFGGDVRLQIGIKALNIWEKAHADVLPHIVEGADEDDVLGEERFLRFVRRETGRCSGAMASHLALWRWGMPVRLLRAGMVRVVEVTA